MNAENPKLTETFERYLDGKMSRRERIEFEARLRIDPDFADAFELHKEIDFILFHEELDFFRRELDKMIRAEDSKPAKAPMLLNRVEDEELEEAILDQDVMNLRARLTDLFEETGEDLLEECVPEYEAIDAAVAQQDAVALHDELGKFGIDPDFGVRAGLSDEEALSRELDQAIMESDVMEFRSKLSKLSKEFIPSKTGRRVALQQPFVRAIAAAAVVILLVGSGLFINHQTGVDQWLDRDMRALTTDQNGPGPARGAELDTDANPWVDFAYKQYLNEEYGDAADAFKIINAEHGEAAAHIWIYLAKSLYMSHNYPEALRFFEQVHEDDNNVYLEEAEWFIAKCLVQLKRFDEARNKLEPIIQSDKHDHKADAVKLYKKIK